MNTNQSKSIYNGYPPTWCPGCGNYGIWAAIKSAFTNLKLDPEKAAVVYGIGCSGNMNDFLWVNSFHSLHGRAVPTAVGIKIANHNLKVLAVVGDGDCYGEGGNHLLHAARGNHDITVLVHDNRVYGLTTGQVAPTAFAGFKAKSTPFGVIEAPLNPLALAITQGATFVAQGFAGDINHLANLIEQAIKHEGFSLVNILQPCVSFNKITTYPWYRERIYKLDGQNYNPKDKGKALEKSIENDKKISIGLIHKEERPVYTDSLTQLKEGPLVESKLEVDVERFVKDFV